MTGDLALLLSLLGFVTVVYCAGDFIASYLRRNHAEDDAGSGRWLIR